MATINYLTTVQLDHGAIKLLGAELHRLSIRRPLIVTDAGVKAAGLLDKALAALPGLKPAVFDQTPSNPNEAAVRAAVAVYQAEGCDGLIALAGRDSEIGRGKIADLEQSKKKTGQVTEGEQFGAVVEAKISLAPGDVLQTFNQLLN